MKKYPVKVFREKAIQLAHMPKKAGKAHFVLIKYAITAILTLMLLLIVRIKFSDFSDQHHYR